MKSPLIIVFLILLTWPQVSWADRTDLLENDLKELKTTSATNNKRLADALVDFEQMRLEMSSLRGKFEENQHFQEEDAKKIQKHLDDIDNRLSGLEERLNLFMDQMRDWTLNSPAQAKNGDAMRLDYQKAFSEMSLGNFDSAIQLFNKFLVKYKASALSDNAQYWKAECFYALKDYQNSILEFQKVVQNYPQSSKVSDAILKQGFSFYALKSYVEAKAFLQKVLSQFTKSENAIKAKEKLAAIDALLLPATSEPQASATETPEKPRPLPSKIE